MKNFVKIAVAFFIVAVVFFACTHKTVVLPVPGTVKTLVPTTPIATDTTDTTQNIIDTSVCFERDILPIFVGSCVMAGCHNATYAKDGYVFTNYANIVAKGIVKGNAAGSTVYAEIAGGKMPKSPIAKLDSTQLSLIARWINMGATDDTDCAPNCDTTKYTYGAAIAPILSFYCYSCHGAAVAKAAGGNFTLDNYDSLYVQAENGNLLNVVRHATGYPAMPLNEAQLAECKITQIEEWINAGAPNN